MIMLFAYCVLPITLSAQTDRDLLMEVVKQQNKLSEQVAEISKQQAVMVTQIAVMGTEIKALDKNMATEIKALDKNIEKRFDLLNIIVAGIFGLFGVLIGVIVWDRRTAIKPFETKTNELEKANEKLQQEIEILKAKELKAEQLFRGFAEIEPRFAEMFRRASVL